MKKKLMIFLIITLSIFCRGTIPTETPKEDIIKKIAYDFIDPTGSDIKKIPGMYIVCISGTEAVKVGAGTTEIGLNNPPSDRTVFPIGSVSKIITSYILASAVANDQLSLDTHASGLLEDINSINPGITLKNLLTHTSGLPNYPDNVKDFRDFDHDGQNDSVFWSPCRYYGKDMLIGFFNDYGFEAETGIRFEYSNVGYGLLALLLENHFAYDDFNALLRNRFSNPLGLQQTGTNEPIFIEKAEDNLSGLYGLKNGNLISVPEPEMGILAGAGGILSCGNDMLLFLNAILTSDNEELIKINKEYYKTLYRINRDYDIGYGFRIRTVNGRKIYTKDGVTFGSTSFIFLCPELSFGIVILANKGHSQHLLSTICQRIFAVLK